MPCAPRAGCYPGVVCGKNSRSGQLRKRPGWNEISGGPQRPIVEIKSARICSRAPLRSPTGGDAIVAALWP